MNFKKVNSDKKDGNVRYSAPGMRGSIWISSTLLEGAAPDSITLGDEINFVAPGAVTSPAARAKMTPEERAAAKVAAKEARAKETPADKAARAKAIADKAAARAAKLAEAAAAVPAV